MNQEKLLLFYEVATLKSIKKAADKMASNSPTVSRIIASIGEELGYELFTSVPNRMTLTRQGEILLDHTKRILLEYESLERDLKSSVREMKGDFTISTNTGLTALNIFESLKNFMDQYPDISLSFIETDSLPDFALRETDIDIRPLRKNNKEIECQYLKTDIIGLYASKEYLIKQETIKSVHEFKKHTILEFPQTWTNAENQNWNWHLPQIPAWNKKMALQSSLLMKKAIETGIGIGPLSQHDVESCPIPLIQILPDMFTSSLDLYFMYPKILSESKVVSELYSYLKKYFSSEE